MRLSPVVFAAAVALTACPAEKSAPGVAPTTQAPPPPPTAARRGQVTLLITGHESGQLPAKAPRLLAQWKQEDGWPAALALSTGDTFSGAVLSSHFFGASTAEVMKALQYKASALGNHDLDLGFDTLQAFRDQSGLTLLAANLKDKPDADQPLELVPSLVLTRDNVKVGVVGFTSAKTLATTVSGRASGLELVPLAQAVGPALESLKKDAPDVVVALMDDCFTALQPVLQAHPEWKVDLVVGTHCEGTADDVGGATKYFSAADDLSSYVSASVAVDATGVTVTARRKDVTKGDDDADLAALRARWQAKLDEALGQKIGFTRSGFKEDATALRTLIATALRDETKADAALINQKGVRAALPKGAITHASVYELIPFENAVLTVKVKGEVLTKFKAMPEAFLLLPPKLEPETEYLLATTEYLYFGGDGLGLEFVAPHPELTGQVWQTPVIAWLRKQDTSEKKPLEKLLK